MSQYSHEKKTPRQSNNRPSRSEKETEPSFAPDDYPNDCQSPRIIVTSFTITVS